MTRKHLFICFLPFFLSTACSKKNTLTGDYCVCKINGEDWRAGCKTAFSSCLNAYWSDSLKTFALTGQNDLFKAISIDIHDTSGLRSGSYTLNMNSRFNSGQYSDYNKSYIYNYNTDEIHQGKIDIIFDKAKSRVSGHFFFTARYELGNDTTNVTDGQFSLPCIIN